MRCALCGDVIPEDGLAGLEHRRDMDAGNYPGAHVPVPISEELHRYLATHTERE